MFRSVWSLGDSEEAEARALRMFMLPEPLDPAQTFSEVCREPQPQAASREPQPYASREPQPQFYEGSEPQCCGFALAMAFS